MTAPHPAPAWTAPAPVLEARHIVKSFGHVQALRGVSLAIHPGEIIALMGDNGAGKTTLTQIFAGAQRPDQGEILMNGEAVSFSGPHDAHAAGIETVYQDLALAAQLDCAENIFLGREITMRPPLGWFGFLDRKAMRREAMSELSGLGVSVVSPSDPVGSLSGGQRQGVAICRAVKWAMRVIFLDEPTAALGVTQSARVLQFVRQARDSGIAVVLISHNIPQVLEVADRIVVLRLGRRVARFDRSQATTEKLVAAMTGALVQEDENAIDSP
jgi:simple sugar transport system ATP-binding protein